jgi:hypothetical protein
VSLGARIGMLLLASLIAGSSVTTFIFAVNIIRAMLAGPR